MQGNHPSRHPIRMIRDYLHNLLQRFTATHTAAAPMAPPLPEDDLELDEKLRSFPGEMFAHLLIELPDQRSSLADAYQAGDLPRLRNNVHQLLGAAAYCNAPELTTSLRELRLALKSDEQETIRYYYLRAIDVIDATLRYSGYKG
ncbi:MAG: Hpt domain-containing protein [Gammaproteobacteria bacterium]